MRPFLLWVVTATILLSGCSEENIVKGAPEAKGQTIEFVTLGYADIPNDANKGFGAFYYCYLNLATDSVFIQKKINLDEQPETLAWAGIITGVAEDSIIDTYLKASKQYKSGEKISKPTAEKELFCGPTYAIRYFNAGEERIHYFTSRDLDVRFEQVKNYLIALQESKLLKPLNATNEDKVVIPIVKLAGPDVVPPPSPIPPPPLPPARP